MAVPEGRIRAVPTDVSSKMLFLEKSAVKTGMVMLLRPPPRVPLAWRKGASEPALPPTLGLEEVCLKALRDTIMNAALRDQPCPCSHWVWASSCSGGAIKSAVKY